MQTEQLALVADRLPLAAVKRLHHAKLRILAEVPDGEGVAVDRNDSGDHEKHRPQGDEKALDDVQGDDLAGKGEAVEQALIGHLLAAVNAETVALIARVEHLRNEADEDAGEGNGHKGHADDAAGQARERRVEQAQRERNGKKQQREFDGRDPRRADQFSGLAPDRSAVELTDGHDTVLLILCRKSIAPALRRVKRA